jgi:hypothetical protein
VGPAAAGGVTVENPDVAALLALHEGALAAHRDGDVDALVAPESDDYVMGNRGELFFPSKDERVAQLGPYLAQTRFTTYRDLVPPVVRVSTDGTLGWVVCQVRIEGTRTMPSGDAHPVDSTWTWVELYEKRGGRWVRTGNVSTMKPVE